jgi:crotonobetainyl-CoA:carnitine CoA-transferase CaiB-like acyl-CoA transferase
MRVTNSNGKDHLARIAPRKGRKYMTDKQPLPLAGVRVIEFTHMVMGPAAGLMLADMGADVIRVEKRSAPFDQPRPMSISSRGKSSIAMDLGAPGGLEALLRLVGKVDVFLDGLGSGVAEQSGCGSARCLSTNPRIVYGCCSGWGQSSLKSQVNGDVTNYPAVGEEARTSVSKQLLPAESLDLVSDISSGMLLAFGILCALIDVEFSGRGQVVDTSASNAAYLLTSLMEDFESKQGRQASEIDRPGSKKHSDFIRVNGMIQPAPTPRFSRAQPEVLWGSQRAGEETETVLRDYGFELEEIVRLRDSGALS